MKNTYDYNENCSLEVPELEIVPTEQEKESLGHVVMDFDIEREFTDLVSQTTDETCFVPDYSRWSH